MTYGPPFSGINLPETAPLQGTSGYGLGKIDGGQPTIGGTRTRWISRNHFQTLVYTRTRYDRSIVR